MCNNSIDYETLTAHGVIFKLKFVSEQVLGVTFRGQTLYRQVPDQMSRSFRIQLRCCVRLVSLVQLH
jgi:hypothetical protein